MGWHETDSDIMPICNICEGRFSRILRESVTRPGAICPDLAGQIRVPENLSSEAKKILRLCHGRHGSGGGQTRKVQGNLHGENCGTEVQVFCVGLRERKSDGQRGYLFRSATRRRSAKSSLTLEEGVFLA